MMPKFFLDRSEFATLCEQGKVSIVASRISLEGGTTVHVIGHSDPGSPRLEWRIARIASKQEAPPLTFQYTLTLL